MPEDRPAVMRDPQKLLAAIVESSDDVILSKDLEGVITSWNLGAERIYGYTAEEAIGRNVSMLVPPGYEDDTAELMARTRRGERIEHYETRRRTRDGRIREMSLTISPIHDDEGRIVGASTIARDITERVLEETRWRHLSEVGRAISEATRTDDLLKTLARALVGDLADYCLTYSFDGEAISRVGTAHADPGLDARVARLLELPSATLSDQSGVGAAIRVGRPMLTRKISEEDLRAAASNDMLFELMRSLEPVSSIILPLIARGRTIGALSLVTTTRSYRRYGERDLALGQEIAERAALALDNIRLFEEAQAEVALRKEAEDRLRRRYAHLRILYELTAAVERAESLEDVYAVVLDGLTDALDVARSGIMLQDDGGSLRFAAWRNLSDRYRRIAEQQWSWNSNYPETVPLLISDLENDRILPEELRSAALAEKIRGLGIFPLGYGGTLVGRFMLYLDEPRELAAEEIDLVRAITGTIGFAILRMRDAQNVRDSRDEAERASAAKSQFLGMMSHELRTPLNAVLGYAELLLLETRGPINESQREQLERIQASARHQLELVDELLTYTRLEAGREEPRLMRIDAGRVVLDAAEFVRPQAEEKGLDLVVDLPDEPMEITTDPARLRQIAINLAANATKYTDEGKVEISSKMEDGSFTLKVHDTGPGIPPEKLDYIFEPFTRVDESNTRQTTGSGLGLAIARRLANLLGGELAVKSEPGRGSTFTLHLPASGPATRARAAD